MENNLFLFNDSIFVLIFLIDYIYQKNNYFNVISKCFKIHHLSIFKKTMNQLFIFHYVRQSELFTMQEVKIHYIFKKRKGNNQKCRLN